MPNSPRMNWPFPAEDQDPWYEVFEDYVTQNDASGFASREDRNLVFSGGGVFSWTADTVAWTETIEILSTIAGFKITVAPNSVEVTDGQVMYLDLTRAPTANVATTVQVASQAPSTDTSYVLAVRVGSVLYFRHGVSLALGTSKNIFSGSTAGPDAVVWVGGRESHNSDVTPLVAGAIAFNPVTYDPIEAIVFRAMAANGDTGLTNTVQLYNLTDGEVVATLSYTSTDIAKDEVTLVRGTGVGEIEDLEKVYEVRLLLGAAPGSANETIELYSAELRIF